MVSKAIVALERETGVRLDDDDFDRAGRLAVEELGGLRRPSPHLAPDLIRHGWGVPQQHCRVAFPQFRSSFLALTGVEGNGQQLVYPDGYPKEGQPVPREMREKIALGLLVEGFVPFAGSFRRTVQERGRAADRTSSILDPETQKKWNKTRKKHVEQEGSLEAALLDWFNPLGVSRRLTERDSRSSRTPRSAEGVRGTTQPPQQAKDPRSEFEEFKNKKTEGVREEFEDYRKKAKQRPLRLRRLRRSQ